MTTKQKRLSELETVVSRLLPTGRPLTFFEDERQPGWYHLGVKSSAHLADMNYELSVELFSEDEMKQYIEQHGGVHIAVVFRKMDIPGTKQRQVQNVKGR